MAAVLYISYTGLSDPLGESQVLMYLIGLARNHRIALITFEKPELISKPGVAERLEKLCRDAGIDWTRLKYHRRPGIPATLYDIANGTRVALRKAKAMRADIVHARSYIAGIMALAVKRSTKARYIFDMRGFWPDERVDGGIWTARSAVYKFFKRVERRLFLSADHIVSLTRAGVREFAQFPYLEGKLPPATVIPTCTNLEVFQPSPRKPGLPFTLGYVGSAGTWYMFPEIARTVRILFEIDPSARFLVINRTEHDYIRACLSGEQVAISRVEILSAPFNEVPHHINRMSAGVFFIKPVFSKRASCPTKMGEFLACGVPCLANSGVGDVAEDLVQSGTGVVVSAFDDESLRQSLTLLLKLAGSPGISSRCRDAAEKRFSLDQGVKSYSVIYESLISRSAQ